jgi:hypothetical protein
MGNHAHVRELVNELTTLLEVEVIDDLTPETAALIMRVLPRRRRDAGE